VLPAAERQLTNVAAGRAAERRARRYYRLRGFRILESNFRAGRNELDLVLRRGQSLVFCEVKMRSREDFGEAAEMVGAEKQRRLRRVALVWLNANPRLASLQLSFEVLALGPGGTERIRDAF
jgi:putative endonuclease